MIQCGVSTKTIIRAGKTEPVPHSFYMCANASSDRCSMARLRLGPADTKSFSALSQFLFSGYVICIFFSASCRICRPAPLRVAPFHTGAGCLIIFCLFSGRGVCLLLRRASANRVFLSGHSLPPASFLYVLQCGSHDSVQQTQHFFRGVEERRLCGVRECGTKPMKV